MARCRRSSNEVSFQSHAGSIEAQNFLRSRASQLKFQSHAGSIEALEARVGELQTCNCFNPTLVRLRPAASGGTWRTRSRFQSHAGSIEALMEKGAKGPEIWSFNPTLVRLRLGEPFERFR